jgi:hypothetical protein
LVTFPFTLGAAFSLRGFFGQFLGRIQAALPLYGAFSHPYNIHVDGLWMEITMADNIQVLRPKGSGKAGDSEKVTVNLGYVDLGHIDLLVEEGFYSNRTDFIRTAIRGFPCQSGSQGGLGRPHSLVLRFARQLGLHGFSASFQNNRTAHHAEIARDHG